MCAGWLGHCGGWGVTCVGVMALAGAASASETELSGRLSRVRGIKVLSLTGSPRANGFARGYLMAREIRATLAAAGSAIGRFLPAGIDAGAFAPLMLSRVARPAHDRDEIEGLVDGMRAWLGERGIVMEHLGRALTPDDIWCLMALPDFGCSSFAAWGGRTGDGLLVGRNLDYAGKELLVDSSCIVVCRPENSRRAPWAELSLSPLPGASTAVNADGVFIAVHDAKATGPASARGRLRGFVIRDFLNAVDGASPLRAQAAAFFRSQPILRGTNFLVASPTAGAFVVEYDGNRIRERGVTMRTPSPGREWVAVTNHFRRRATCVPCGRYDALATALSEAPTARPLCSLRDGWSMISRSAQDSTLLTAVYRHVDATVLVGFTDGRTPAHKREPVVVDLTEVWKAVSR